MFYCFWNCTIQEQNPYHIVDICMSQFHQRQVRSSSFYFLSSCKWHSETWFLSSLSLDFYELGAHLLQIYRHNLYCVLRTVQVSLYLSPRLCLSCFLSLYLGNYRSDLTLVNVFDLKSIDCIKFSEKSIKAAFHPCVNVYIYNPINRSELTSYVPWVNKS